MSPNCELVSQTVSVSLMKDKTEVKITRDLISSRVDAISKVMDVVLDEEEKKSITNKLEAAFQITMSIGSKLVDASYRPWVHSANEQIDWVYWRRYKQFLLSEDFGPNVVVKLDLITTEILDLMQNPKDAGEWQRKGLVVGQVQSGKTANFLGVVCKALDAGYRVVVILSGLLNSLRQQTQERVDQGVVGLDSGLPLGSSLLEKLVGVGKISHNESLSPVSITTLHDDFNKAGANQRQMAIQHYAPPLVFVIKKNVSILQNLLDWLVGNNVELSSHPMLLIDDEADHASINTNKPDIDPVKTNAAIRKLLAIFPKSVYLGYTATPFANIFINPDTDEEMLSDLFPENFIKTLEPPTNYFGADRVFGLEEGGPFLPISDGDSFIPEKHKKELRPTDLPESLRQSIRCFIIVCAIRLDRGQDQRHNSMMINVTRFTDIQSHVRVLVHEYLSELVDSIKAYHKLDIASALKDTNMRSIHETWVKIYAPEGNTWDEIQVQLGRAAAKIEVIEVNSSPQAEKTVDYSKRNYPNGRSLVAIGGLSLSRGITLEGLSITYLLRNSLMYDTLMQMGRWFGYRNGYEDLCRVFMTHQARGWYQHIASASDELRAEFRRMEQLKRSPKDFGLLVRNHPESLIVTARNKMRSAKTIVRQIDLTGRLIETSRLFTDPSIVNRNLKQLGAIVRTLKQGGVGVFEENSGHRLWRDVPYQIVSNFVEGFTNHPESAATETVAVKRFVDELATEDDLVFWNVLVVSPKDAYRPGETKVASLLPELSDINAGIRRTCTECAQGITLGNRKLGQEGIETRDLVGSEVRSKPLLMLHLLDCRIKKDDLEQLQKPVFENGAVGYGMAFPGEKSGKRLKKLVTYQVNTVWMQENHGSEVESDEDLGADL